MTKIEGENTMGDGGRRHSFRFDEVEPRIGARYPKPYDQVAPNRMKYMVGDRAGITQYGVNVTILPPGQQSALRHWHRNEDEFVIVLEGEVVLITDDGEETLGPGMCAGFPAGIENGHHLVNRSGANARFIEVGTRARNEEAFYPDDDLHVVKDGDEYTFTRKNGEPA
ncbi:MAG: cupin domain-containing protein [Rhodospirillales bacterium]